VPCGIRFGGPLPLPTASWGIQKGKADGVRGGLAKAVPPLAPPDRSPNPRARGPSL